MSIADEHMGTVRRENTGYRMADLFSTHQVEVYGKKIGPLLCERDLLVVLDWLSAVGVDGLRAALTPAGSPGDGPDTAPHVRGSDTSKAAARAVAPNLAGKRLAVLREVFDAPRTGLLSTGGFTDNELTWRMMNRYAWSQHTPRPRRIELTRAGWLEDSRERRAGSTVWRPTDKAWTWWREQQSGGAS